jgi:hypothetical protein
MEASIESNEVQKTKDVGECHTSKYLNRIRGDNPVTHTRQDVSTEG